MKQTLQKILDELDAVNSDGHLNKQCAKLRRLIVHWDNPSALEDDDDDDSGSNPGHPPPPPPPPAGS